MFSITEKVKMKNIYCVNCKKYKKRMKNPEISYLFL